MYRMIRSEQNKNQEFKKIFFKYLLGIYYLKVSKFKIGINS